jgi:hypothetical protein
MIPTNSPQPRVAGPVHPDRPGGPRLGGQPGDDLAQVGLLARRVLVGRDSLRGPRPPQVDPGHRVPVLPAQPLVLRPVRRGGVVLAVRQRLQHHRHRLPRVRHVQADRKPNPILHRDPAPPLDHGGILPTHPPPAQCSGWLSDLRSACSAAEEHQPVVLSEVGEVPPIEGEQRQPALDAAGRDPAVVERPRPPASLRSGSDRAPDGGHSEVGGKDRLLGQPQVERRVGRRPIACPALPSTAPRRWRR